MKLELFVLFRFCFFNFLIYYGKGSRVGINILIYYEKVVRMKRVGGIESFKGVYLLMFIFKFY